MVAKRGAAARDGKMIGGRGMTGIRLDKCVNLSGRRAGLGARWGALTMRAAPLAILCAIAAACALMPNRSGDLSPRAIMDAYLIAHGMAESYGDQPDADPAVLAELARLDQRAASAIRDLSRASPGSEAATASAVAALSDYAASQTSLPR